MSTGRKLPHIIDGPIDVILLDIIEYIKFPRPGIFTPNMLTSLSFGFGLLACYLVYTYKFVFGAVSYSLSYFFDCVDGYVARKYNMVSSFGDVYDHATDILVELVLFYILYLLNPLLFLQFVPAILLLFCLMRVHFSFQEKYTSATTSPFLRVLDILNPFLHDGITKTEIENYMRYTRYFSCGTFNLFIVCMILFYGWTAKNELKVSPYKTSDNTHLSSLSIESI
jgi:phosphatidylglycerophosphate synthase